MSEEIVIAYIGQDCEKVVEMSLKSVKDADAIVFLDGGSTDNTKKIVKKYAHDFMHNDYKQIDKMMNGKQRNIYLNFVKERYPGWWCLVLDPDEIVEDFSKIKEFIQKAPKDFLYSIKMRHLIGDLGHEDASLPVHFVPHRLFYITDDLHYPETEHPVLQNSNVQTINHDMTTIWHLSYIPNMWELKKKYENHIEKSEMHTKQYLKNWYYAHIFGQFPTAPINIIDLPKILLEEFGIDKDELYFANRGLETKHFIDAIHWKEFFKCKNAIEFGCGKGPRVYAMRNIGIKASGLEISKFAVENRLSNYVVPGDAKIDTVFNENMEKKYDLSIAYDLLEHINYEDLDKTINNIIKHTKKYILVSVPVLGNPNLEADSTHIIKENKEWWIKQFTNKDLKLIPTPKHFLYKEQVMIFEK